MCLSDYNLIIIQSGDYIRVIIQLESLLSVGVIQKWLYSLDDYTVWVIIQSESLYSLSHYTIWVLYRSDYTVWVIIQFGWLYSLSHYTVWRLYKSDFTVWVIIQFESLYSCDCLLLDSAFQRESATENYQQVHIWFLYNMVRIITVCSVQYSLIMTQY